MGAAVVDWESMAYSIRGAGTKSLISRIAWRVGMAFSGKSGWHMPNTVPPFAHFVSVKYRVITIMSKAKDVTSGLIMNCIVPTTPVNKK
jgi:hypothetical protein